MIKKIFKKEVIIAFIIGIILASSIAVYAYSYAAKDVSYTKPGTTTAINVETALNELYNKKDLLWENSNSSVEFANQKLTFNLSNYTAIIILGKLTATDNNIKSYSYIEVGKNGKLEMFDTDGAYSTYRYINVLIDGVEIGKGLASTVPETNTNNLRAIPTYIFGVK